MTESKPRDGLGARAWKRLAWMWVNFWLARSGRGFFGRIATRLAACGYPPYTGRLELARIQPKGYLAASAQISHTNLTIGNNVFIGDRVIIYQHEGGGSVELGDRVMLFQDIIVETFAGGSLRIGTDTAVQPRCHFTAAVAPISDRQRRSDRAPMCVLFVRPRDCTGSVDSQPAAPIEGPDHYRR